ncbi:MAG: glycosyltransferase family 4 protein [Verrucomicrobia bacterium]|nr:glycosyltransferase family 4 protein [Verrucomicrobiota bacterium]
MIIGLDVSQTCAERAGCAWYADGLSRALIAAGLPRGHAFELYHHFGGWINADTRGGTLIDDPRVSAPLRGLAPDKAREFWREVESGEPLPAKPDVVLSFNFHAPRLPHSRLVYTVHDLAFWMHPAFATDETHLVCQREVLQALARAAGFLFNSQHTRDELELLFPSWLRLTGRPSLVAHGASRFPAPGAPPTPGPAAPWLVVGSLEPRKNHAAALDAYELYHAHSSVRRPLVVAGGAGWKSDAIRARLSALQGRGLTVHTPGYVPDAELAGLYASSFALVCPSWHEGFGLPLVEALTAGLPVLSSDRASLPEVGGDAPVYFAPDQPAALAEAMLALERDPAAHARRAAASLARGGAFSWAATAKSVLEFVERL